MKLKLPEYTPLAAQASIQGTVTAVVKLQKDGSMKVENRSGHPLLEPVVRKALQESIFTSCAKNEVVLEFEFALLERDKSNTRTTHYALGCERFRIETERPPVNF